MYPYGLIGNCQIAALVSDHASIDWLCLPRPDSAPTFGAILDEDGGRFSITPLAACKTSQAYIKNTNVLKTTFSCGDQSGFEVIDFCPRFEQFGRMFRPSSLIRIVRPVSGSSRIRVDCNPVMGWCKTRAEVLRGNAHLNFRTDQGSDVRLTTNMPLTYLIQGQDFLLQEPLYFVLGWQAQVEDDLAAVCLAFLDKTTAYWQKWVKHCSIPSQFQDEVIRSALALKLHCYDDTGAILAAVTTSLPEQIGHERNWDYRFCWLRDAFFTLNALHSLGHFEEMEGFLRFIVEIVDFATPLSPVYGIDRSIPDGEAVANQWLGYKGSKPVRYLNAAASQIQNDAYGEILLALNPIYQDERFHHLRTEQLHRVVSWLTEKCIASVGVADAGLWEIRGGTKEHSFTNLMCWAGLDRVLSACRKRWHEPLSEELCGAAQAGLRKAYERVLAACKDGIVFNGPGDPTLDSSLLMLSTLRFPDEALRAKTLEAIMRELALPGHPEFLMRYARPDDFGKPDSAFLICSFWLIQSLAKEGRIPYAKEVFVRLLAAGNHLGLFSEHFDPVKKIQLGNFPQCYSHVGIINAAFAVSRPWDQVL